MCPIAGTTTGSTRAWEGEAEALTRKPGDRPERVVLAWLRDWPSAEKTRHGWHFRLSD